MNHVKQFPSLDTLAEVRSYADGTEPELPVGWVAMTEAETRAWISEQKEAGWVPIRPSLPHRVSKDTMTMRILEAGKIAECRSLVESLSADDRFVWDQASWFWSNNDRIRGMLSSVGLDPDVVMAPDPYAP